MSTYFIFTMQNFKANYKYDHPNYEANNDNPAKILKIRITREGIIVEEDKY